MKKKKKKKKKAEASLKHEGLNVRIRRGDYQCFVAKQQSTEPRKRTTYSRTGRHPKVKSKRS